MSVQAMAAIGGDNVLPAAAKAPKRPDARKLLEIIGAYIPTEIATFYIALAASIAAFSPPMDDVTKLRIALALALMSSLVTWSLIHRDAQKKNKDPDLMKSLIGGSFEILVAGAAFFLWAAAMPGSWFSWGQYGAVLAPLALFLFATAVGAVAVLLNRPAQ